METNPKMKKLKNFEEEKNLSSDPRQLYQQYLRHLSTIKKRIRKKNLKTAVKIDEQRPDVLKTHATGI
jgi:hypothetical protein